MNKTDYLYHPSPIGVFKIAATADSISEISFVDDPIQTDHSTSANPLLWQCVQELTEYFDGKRLTFTVPVYQNGTAFQTRVWNELLNIGFGKTISYLTLAKRLGDPNCIRAAASSNGKNNIAIVVPCHRVIGSNQTLVGYAGGLWRKKFLLDHENRFANGLQTLFS